MSRRGAPTAACLTALLGALLASLGAARTVRAQAFTYNPAGTLLPGSGTGVVTDVIYVPDMRFPIEAAPAFANSQVYGRGGAYGPGGGLCDAENFAYPWWDNFCETRGRSGNTTPMCPNQNGSHHAGQDIRAASCDKTSHWGVAVLDGTITNVGSYSVDLTTATGLRFQYLHMDNVQVTEGQVVAAGTRLGTVSNRFFDSNGNPVPTSVHLHFGIKANAAGIGVTWVPPYTSLVPAYKRLLGDAEWSASVDGVRSSALTLSAGIETEVEVTLTNTGKATWLPGETNLGTTGPRDRESAFRTTTWMSPGRVVSVPKEVGPGESVTLLFPLRAVDTPGSYTEDFGLVQEGVTWFADSGGPADSALRIAVEVTPPVPYRGVFEGHTFVEDGAPLALRAGETAEGTVSVRNTGTETWLAEETELRTTGPRDRESAFAAGSWISEARVATLEDDVPPGKVGVFKFRVRAPFMLGEHAETFGVWNEAGGWFGDQGGPSDDAIRIVVNTTEQGPGAGSGLESGCAVGARRGGPSGAAPLLLCACVWFFARRRRRVA